MSEPVKKKIEGEDKAVRELAVQYAERLSKYEVTHDEYRYMNNGGDLFVYRMAEILAEITPKTLLEESQLKGK